jgi:hypothetical protein
MNVAFFDADRLMGYRIIVNGPPLAKAMCRSRAMRHDGD